MRASDKDIFDSIINQADKNDKKIQFIYGNEASEPDDWEQPIAFDDINVPVFPVECLPPTVRNYVKAISESTQTPVDMAAVASLAVMALCIQGKYKVQGKPDWIEPLNLYSVIVAKPAERKSAVLKLATKYINEYEQTTNELRKAEINRNKLEKKTLEKEIDSLMNSFVKGKSDKSLLIAKQDELTDFKETKPLRLLADDVSAEALTSLLASNDGRMAAISSEGGIFEILNGRYTTGVNIDTFLKAHCGDPIRIDRKGRESEYIPEPCLTTLLMIQPQVLDGLITNEVFRGRGLTARFLYCIPNSMVGDREFETQAIPDRYATEYKELCFNLLDIGKGDKAEIINLSNEAYKLSAEFARELEPRLIEDLDSISDFAGKLHGAILRIAGILHLTEQLVFSVNEPIPANTMQNAIEIGLYFLEHAKAAYQLMGADEQLKNVKHVLKKLENQQDMKLKRYNIFKMCRNANIKNVSDIEPSITCLIDYGYIKELPPETREGAGRKPDIVYSLNPLYFKQ